MRPRPFRLRNLLVIVLVAVFVNAPLVYDTYAHRRLDQHGREVQATVTDKYTEGDSTYLLVVRFPGVHDVVEQSVPRGVYDAAPSGTTVPARVLDHPEVHEVDGAIRSDVPLGLAVLGDGGLLLVIVAMLVYRRRFRVPELWAVQDLRLIEGGASLVRVGSTEYIVSGEVVVAERDVVEIDTGGERVRVRLVGYANPVGEHGHAQAVGRVPPGRMET